MAENECEETECPPAGAPEWVMTFADLMSLLMVFFVLLLSFSEMDLQKYKQVAGSMKMAFGVQREVKVNEIPAGTSIIAQEFSPAQPEPTLVNQITQQTIDDLRQYLKVEQEAAEDAKEKAEELKKALKEEIDQGLLQVSVIDDQVVVRILDKGSFDSASAAISPEFGAMLAKIADSLNTVDGKIIIAGHTDDIPIDTAEFPSNWVLSAARAAAVAHTMTELGSVDPTRLEIRAYGENKPLESNDTAEGRAKNRRVEIIVMAGSGNETMLKDIADDLSKQTSKAGPE